MSTTKLVMKATLAALAAGTIMGTAPAMAAPPPPPSGQDCGGVISDIQRVSPTAIQATWTLECNYYFLGAMLPVGVAVRTSDNQTIYARREACTGQITSCSVTATFPDVDGVQTYQLTWDPDAYISFAGAQTAVSRCGDPNLYAIDFCQRLTVQY